MRVSWLGIVVTVMITATVQPCLAGEFAGRLERVDREAVTLRGGDNRLLVVRVDSDHRLQAAPLLGRWVIVEFQTVQGKASATNFRCR